MSENSQDMREFMYLVEAYAMPPTMIEPEVVEIIEIPPPQAILADLHDLVVKLRAHTENADGDCSLGIEQGMQLASDMIENLMRRHEGPDLGY